MVHLTDSTKVQTWCKPPPLSRNQCSVPTPLFQLEHTLRDTELWVLNELTSKGTIYDNHHFLFVYKGSKCVVLKKSSAEDVFGADLAMLWAGKYRLRNKCRRMGLQPGIWSLDKRPSQAGLTRLEANPGSGKQWGQGGLHSLAAETSPTGAQW